MEIEECIAKSKDWLADMKHKQLINALIKVEDQDLDRTVVLFESLLNHLEDCNEVEDEYKEMISTLEDDSYEKGYNQAIEDVVFELNNQDIDSDIITLIENM